MPVLLSEAHKYLETCFGVAHKSVTTTTRWLKSAQFSWNVSKCKSKEIKKNCKELMEPPNKLRSRTTLILVVLALDKHDSNFRFSLSNSKKCGRQIKYEWYIQLQQPTDLLGKMAIVLRARKTLKVRKPAKLPISIKLVR